MNIYRVYGVISTPFRKRRMASFERQFHITNETTILDVGGTPGTWDLVTAKPKVTLLNLTLPDQSLPENIDALIGDGTSLPFSDRSFDLTFSNSVIEHLHTKDRQLLFASEIMRVGKFHYVQTPNRRFPIEPHYLGIGIQFLPLRAQPLAIRWLSVRGWMEKPSKDQCAAWISEIRLLSRMELQDLFPKSTIRSERLLFFTKSFTVTDE